VAITVVGVIVGACLWLHGHWLQLASPFEGKQKRNRGGQTNETAHPPTIGLSSKDVSITHNRTPYKQKRND